MCTSLVLLYNVEQAGMMWTHQHRGTGWSAGRCSWTVVSIILMSAVSTASTRSTLARGRSSSCTTAADCSFNGHCGLHTATGVCVCQAAWKGHRCSELNLLPVRHGTGYHATENGQNVSSWGGAVLQVGRGWTMWAAEMVGHCGPYVCGFSVDFGCDFCVNFGSELVGPGGVRWKVGTSRGFHRTTTLFHTIFNFGLHHDLFSYDFGLHHERTDAHTMSHSGSTVYQIKY
jgi:hypothetical protein